MKRLVLLILISLPYVVCFSQVTTVRWNVYGSEVKDAINTNFVYTTANYFFPNQVDYPGTLFLSNGGDSLSNDGLDAGSYNTYVGVGSGLVSSIAKRNTAVGYNTLTACDSGWANTAIGYNTLSTGTGSFTPAIDAFYANTAVGEGCMVATTTGSYNTAIGVNALLNNTTGHNNAAFRS